jgi:Bacterial low temperature requirement A protein (LtrA)
MEISCNLGSSYGFLSWGFSLDSTWHISPNLGGSILCCCRVRSLPIEARQPLVTNCTDLAAEFSFSLIRIIYCFWIPELRRETFIVQLLGIPSIGLWVGSIFLSWPLNAAVIIPALLLGSLVTVLTSIPITQRWLHLKPREPSDPDQIGERLRAFFIIILGEGVASLIQDSNLDYGFTHQTGFGILALVIYHALFLLLFYGDQSRLYIHALHRTSYTSLAFQMYVYRPEK